MPNLHPQLLADLREHRLPGLDLGAEFIYPKYEGQSILNIPSSICRWLNAPPFGVGAGALRPEILLPPGDGIRRVLLILMDALSLHRFQSWLENGDLPVWQALLDDGLLAPLTSISPSTTCAATTTLWTGHSAASHGVIGYEMFLKEYGLVANMILHTPMSFHGGGLGSLEHAGFEPEEFITVPRLGSHLHAHGVTAYAFQHHHIAHSGLSRMFMQDVEIKPFSTPAEMWINVRQLIEDKPEQRLYSWIYWGNVDGLSHYYEPDDERVLAEFTNFSFAFEEFFLKRLRPSLRKDTLLILTADHGQINTLDDPKYFYKNHPQLDEMLHIKPTGENRLMFLYVQPGKLNAVEDYFNQTWPDQFSLLAPDQAIESGLFGPGEQHPNLRQRMGDLIAIPHENAYLWWGDKDNFLRGRHGGLTAEEMLVPFLAVRL